MITFYSLIDGGFTPRRASKSGNGTLTTAGYRYCEPLRTATGFGWNIFLPIEFWLIWDGSELCWSIDEGSNWYPLGNAIQYPGFSDQFSKIAPDDCKNYAPPFILRAVDHDILQIWTGQLVRTAPGIAILVRAPVNVFWRTDYAVFEGIVETDTWFGPLFSNIRLRKMNTPIVFRTTEPFLQVQPIPLSLLNDFNAGEELVYQGLDTLTDEDWQAYKQTVVKRVKTRKKLGDYATNSRKRLKLHEE